MIDKIDTRGLGPRIRQARSEKGLTARELADAVGVSRTMICRYEAGQSIPSAVILARIGYALDRSMEWLVFGADLPPGPLDAPDIDG